MERIWIRDKGMCNEEGLAGLLKDQLSSDNYFVAYQTDRFLSGKQDEIKGVDISKLLEIRVFDEQTELLARRSTIGKFFKWRIADDRTLLERVKQLADDKENIYPTDESMYSRIVYQTLDVNIDKSDELRREDGSFIRTEFMSTVGGRYALPVMKGTQKIKTKTYYRYDSDGMISADDFRICSFEEA